MLFSKEFDSSLWFILKSDKKYRKEIMDILNNMPQELYKKIQDEIKKVELEHEDNQNDIDVFENAKGKNGYTYGFRLSYCCGAELNLFKGMWNKESLETIFSISLQELSEYKNRDFEEWLGNIDANITDVDCVYSADETEYMLYSTPVFSTVIYSRDIQIDENKDKNTLPRIKFVNGKGAFDLTVEKLNQKTLKKSIKR